MKKQDIKITMMNTNVDEFLYPFHNFNVCKKKSKPKRDTCRSILDDVLNRDYGPLPTFPKPVKRSIKT